MQYLVVEWSKEEHRQVGVNRDGSLSDLEHAELYATEADARATVATHGGQVAEESEVFGDDPDDEE